MSEPLQAIFNQVGVVVGWLNDDEIIDLDGEFLAFTSDKRVFSYFDGSYRGEFENGYFWDTDGYAVAFIKGAINGPFTPLTEFPPFPPLLAFKPFRPGVNFYSDEGAPIGAVAAKAMTLVTSTLAAWLLRGG